MEEPGEAARLSVLFEELAFHDAKEAARQEREARRSSNSGDGTWTETSIGDDDEVDWKDASGYEDEEE